jgi:hypothetical protein
VCEDGRKMLANNTLS